MTNIVFVSGVQRELREEREAIRDFINGDPLLRRFFSVTLFEDLPAADHTPQEVYLREVDRCTIYLGIFADDYGTEDNEGISSTEREFERATTQWKCRLVFVKGEDDSTRHSKMLNLIHRADSQLTRRRFSDTSGLIKKVDDSLTEFLFENGMITELPFDQRDCSRATLSDISPEKLRWFIRLARKERNFPLSEESSPEEVLTDLNLLDDGQPTTAAILLFGKNPQRFLPNAQMKCVHFYGREEQKPIPSYQTYQGTIFDQVDQATDFVLSKLNRRVPPREDAPASDTKFEVPKAAINEAIVNAAAHRDYISSAGIKVAVFSDRIEITNPGELPPDLTPAKLKGVHSSYPHNPRIAHPLYLTHYIESLGTGTRDIFSFCKEAGLAEPEFRQIGREFMVTIWRDWLTDKVMLEIGLSERQITAVNYVKEHGQITHKEYLKIVEVSKPTASRDLAIIVKKGVFIRTGSGPGTIYTLGKGPSI